MILCKHNYLPEMCEACKALDKIAMAKVREWEREFKQKGELGDKPTIKGPEHK